MTSERNIKQIAIPIYNLKIPVSENNTFLIQFRVKTEDGSKISAWSNVYEVDAPAIEGGDTITVKDKTNKFNLSWEDDNNRTLYDVYAYKFSNIDLTAFGSCQKSRPTSTSAEITLYYGDTISTNYRLPHNLKVGMRIAVSGLGAGDYDMADTYVTSIIDPYTFRYSPVPSTTVDLTPATDSTGLIQIFGTASAGYSMDINDYEYFGRTDKNTYSISKSISKQTFGNAPISRLTYNSTATDIWCLIQPASANTEPDSDLDIATGYLAI